MNLVASADVASRIKDFAGLVGLVLVLITLFTNQRATTLRSLGAKSKKADATQEACLLAVLMVVTTLLFLVGLPVLIQAVNDWHPRAFAGPVRAAFGLSWVLLVGLIGWQGSLIYRALAKVRPGLPAS